MSAGGSAPNKPVPDFGLLLAPLIGPLSDGERPALLARLELAAAARYRAWAAEAPQHAAELFACASGEDEIAAHAVRLFPLSAAQAARLDALMPRAREMFFEPFAGLELRGQFALQAAAELQGARAWRGIAATPGLPHAMREALATCAALEEASAARLEKMLANWTA